MLISLSSSDTFILRLQSDFKGNPGLQLLISLQNNGKTLLYLPKI